MVSSFIVVVHPHHYVSRNISQSKLMTECGLGVQLPVAVLSSSLISSLFCNVLEFFIFFLVDDRFVLFRNQKV